MNTPGNMASIVPFEEAGQTEDLVSRLRGLVRDYPDGVGIVKELLQNADDAGATWVRFTLDLQSHRTGALPAPTMKHLMGPSLLVESDQSFTVQDLLNIQYIGNAGKARDGGKTGRFGLGFNTVYNVTDYPAFATGDLIMCFDPHRDVLGRNGGRPGALWRLAHLWEAAPDWPAAFGLTPGAMDMGRRTIFRLPLRTPEQTGDDRIASHPFPPDRVERIFSELESWGASLLLFLRSVLSVSAEIVHPDQRRERWISIRTIDEAGIEATRARLAQAREGTMKALLRRWKELGGDGPSEVYRHRFLVQTRSGDGYEDWCVSQGLFFGKDRKVLAAACAMDAIDERAVPLAGAAVRVSAADHYRIVPEAISGHLFCTLPLPDPVSIPFHLNAFFDLDSSRSRITQGHAVGDAAIRVDWNEALLRQALPEAVSLVFEYLKSQLADNKTREFYDLWPDVSRLSAALGGFGESIYNKLAPLPLLRTRQSGEMAWVSAQQIKLPPAWSSGLVRALKDDGVALPEPAVPAHMVQGFDAAGSRLQRWSPAPLRDWLRVSEDLQCHVADAPRACLRTLDTVVELLRFCVTGERATLDGLPLALMSDGRLRAFNRGWNIFVADATIREIFRARPSWFLDAAIESAIPELPLGSGLMRMDAACAIQNLKTHLQTQTWLPHGSEVPNNAWLADLFRWLAGLPSQAVKDGALSSLALVPDDRDRLWRPGRTSTPLLPDDGLAKELRMALAEFGVPLVSGTTELMASIRLFVARHAKMIWGITAVDVLDTLGKRTSPGESVAANAASRVKLLTWLAEQDMEEPLDTRHLEELGRMAIWPTEDQQIVTTEDAFLPSGFQAPTIGGRVTLLDPGPAGAWRRLLSRIGVQDLDIGSFVRKSFLPSYASLNEAGRCAALGWLRDHGWAATQASTAPQKLRDAIKQAKLVRGMDEAWYSAGELYRPDVGVERILGPLAKIPDMTQMYRDEPEAWLEFFDALGIRRQPREQDIVARIDQLVATTSVDTAVEEALCVILHHVDERWERLEDAARKRLGGELRKRAWIPTLTEPPEGVAVFTRPASRLVQPSEVYPHRLLHLVASQAPMIRLRLELKRELREALGMPGDARIEVALAHFKRVRELWGQPQLREVSPDSVGKTADETMRLLGRHMGAKSSVDRAAVQQALDELRDTPCIWDPRRERFWKPRHVFAEPVPYFGDLRSSGAYDSGVAPVLEALGWRRRPATDDIVDFLDEMGRIVAQAPLEPRQVTMVIAAWRELERADYEPSKGSHPLVLTTSNRLHPMSASLVDDAPWWRERLHAADLPWVHASMAPFVAALGTPRASKEVLEEVLERGTRPSLAVAGVCERREAHLKSDVFLSGLARLVIHEHGGSIDEDVLRERAALRLIACERLRTCLRCPDFGVEDAVGEADVPCLLEEESWGAQIYVATADDDELVPALADAVNRRLGDQALRNLAPLEDIIRCAADRVHSKLDLRKIPRLPESSMPDRSDDFEPINEGETSGEDDRSISVEADVDEAQAEAAEGTNSDTGGRSSHVGTGRSGRVPTQPAIRPWSTSSSDRPPTTPHEGERANVPGRASGRFRSYAEAPTPDSHSLGDAAKSSQQLEDAALVVVEAEEMKRGCTVVRVSHQSAGYNLEILDPAEDRSRLVGVKGLDARWGQSGVALSPDELRTAQREGDRFWLYVVECAPDSSRAVVNRIQDPAGKVQEFRFDEGWRGLTKIPSPKDIPAEGCLLKESSGARIGIIRKVSLRGVTTRLGVELPDGTIRQITYNAETQRIEPGDS